VNLLCMVAWRGRCVTMRNWRGLSTGRTSARPGSAAARPPDPSPQSGGRSASALRPGSSVSRLGHPERRGARRTRRPRRRGRPADPRRDRQTGQGPRRRARRRRPSAVVRRANPLGQEFLPRPPAHGPVWRQVRAVSKRPGGPSRDRDRHERSAPAARPQVRTEQVGCRIHPWPADVGNEAGRRGERKFHEAGSRLSSVDGLAALIRAREAADEAGVAFRVDEPSPPLRRTAEVHGVEDLLPDER
jgi:hypothetical protein